MKRTGRQGRRVNVYDAKGVIVGTVNVQTTSVGAAKIAGGAVEYSNRFGAFGWVRKMSAKKPRIVMPDPLEELRRIVENGRPFAGLEAIDALEICNGCDAAPIAAGSRAGYCVECESDARAGR